MVRPSKQNFVENLNRRMKEMGCSGSELARRVGVAPTSVMRWRKGIQEPSFKDIDHIARALGVSPTALFLDPDDEAPTPYVPDVEEALRILQEAVRKPK